MTQNAGVAGPFFYKGTVTADATAVSILSLMSGLVPSGRIVSFFFKSDIPIGLGNAASPPTNITDWPLVANEPFTDASALASDNGPSLDQYLVFTTGAGNATIRIYLRTC